jgi:gamma-glutamylcyclotransferase (GGCT)/AIG2-like uncharacterized protein YtfP
MERIFVYGIWRTGKACPDAVQGELYQTVSGIAAAKFGQGVGLVRGEVREVDDATLAYWDPIERAYDRIKVRTTRGEEVWAYQYRGEIENMRRLPAGIWRGRTWGAEAPGGRA